MKQIIKTWLKDHQIELPDERIDLLITMLKSREKDIIQQERERIIENLPKKMEVDNTDDDYVRHMAGGFNEAIEEIIKRIKQ